MATETSSLATVAPPESLAHRSQEWSLFGAGLGVASTSVCSALAATLAAGEAGVGAALLVALALSGPAAALGALFGRRWKRRVERDAHRVSVARWLGRMAVDGAVFAAASTAGTMGLFGAHAATFGRAPDLGGFLGAAGLAVAIAAPVGALTLAAAGVPFLVSLGRGRRPWRALALAAALAPPAVVGVIGSFVWLVRG